MESAHGCDPSQGLLIPSLAQQLRTWHVRKATKERNALPKTTEGELLEKIEYA